MLTVGYGRVSTEEQAAEGFSIDGQAEKLRTYARLHDLGPLTFIEDPGLSGKDLNRPGLQEILMLAREGRVANIVLWRLDRLLRNLGDLILLAEEFLSLGVGLHSVTENLDLSTASGRMYFNIIGTFAQFYREQLSENVRMGMSQAAREGRWTNRPKTGYDLVNGELVPNRDAPIVRRIFELRAKGMSHREVSERTAVNHSTILGILKSRIYLGEVLHEGNWIPGRHEPVITLEEFEAAHRGFRKGKRRGKDTVSGHVRCGQCSRAMSIDQNGQGHTMYKCAHRGNGCAQTRRSSKGLLRAALLGLRLVGSDQDLQSAIRRELDGARRGARQGASRDRQRTTKALGDLAERRRKLLELYYADRITGELFATEEQNLAQQIAVVREEQAEIETAITTKEELGRRFEDVLATFEQLDFERVWEAATDNERRVLIEELLEAVTVYPDHLEVAVHGAPTINVLLGEVGLVDQSDFARVGGGT